ncbi:MAG: GPR endopeptidase [Bacilli bacterium]|nr:GPR endopeptidase [Bacilli bacterium]
MKNYEYQIRTDLALQNKALKNTRTSKINNIIIKKFSNQGLNYTNILFSNLETTENKNLVKEVFVQELHKYIRKYKLKKSASVLVVGLGNPHISSDALGPTTLAYITPTAHFKSLNLAKNKRSIYAFTSDTLQNTGIEAFRSIKALQQELHPDFIIIIDSLISGSIDYLNKLIQISDCGITPGSGISNYQTEISYQTLNIPVIAVGVPTAIEASTIIKDALALKTNKITFKKGYDLIVYSKDTHI